MHAVVIVCFQRGLEPAPMGVVDANPSSDTIVLSGFRTRMALHLQTIFGCPVNHIAYDAPRSNDLTDTKYSYYLHSYPRAKTGGVHYKN